MKKAFLLVGVLTAAAWLAIRLFAPVRPPSNASLHVVATFYPLAEFARQIGGARFDVRTLVPPGAEPHDYEPTPQDILDAEQADLFVMNGGVDGWADRLLPDLRRHGVRVVRVADRLPEVNRDPHVWLDPVLAEDIVKSLRDALGGTDTEYADRAAGYLAALDALDADYRSGLSRCRTHTIVTSHDAFGYLARRYELDVVPIAGLSPDAEPSPARMAEIARLVERAGTRYIFFETLASPKLAQTLAEETGARTLGFNPLEGLTPSDLAAGKNYLSVMRDNLAQLRTALVCQ